MLSKIKLAIEKLDILSKSKPIKIISHYDTDGITSAAIFSRAMQRWNKKFSIQIVKGLEENFIKSLPEDQILIFLDLASGNLNNLKEKNTEIFIFDHHEVIQQVPSNVTLINPLLESPSEKLSGAAVCYLFAKTLSEKNKDLANLAIIGTVGDLLEKEIGKFYQEILNDSEATIKKGLLLYPSTRPIDKVLEYSSNPYLPGITGSPGEILELLKDAGITRVGNTYKSLHELTEKEMSNLITSMMLHGCLKERDAHQIIGNLYLIKFFNKLEDARELSALINACSRMDYPQISLGFCLGIKSCKEKAKKIYVEYKQQIISALKYVSGIEKISGKSYLIINAKDNIKDTIIGTIASILSHSPVYNEGTIIVALAYNEDKIKVSARITGHDKEKNRNVREVLNRVVVPLGGEVGGHPNAAGCLISKEKENKFIEELRRELEIELVKV